jgi:hypothetical protein
MHKILASDIVVPQTTGIPHIDREAFGKRSGPAIKSFIESILLHDAIVVPISEFTTLWLLLDTFGERTIIDLLERKILTFCRYQGLWAYGTRGFGLVLMIAPEGAYEETATKYSPVDKALDFTLKAMPAQPSDPRLKKAVLAATTLFDGRANGQMVIDATYKDVISHGILDLRPEHFRDVPKYIDESVNNPADDMGKGWRVNSTNAVLALADFNMHMAMFREAECTVNATRLPVMQLLNGKARGEASVRRGNESFAIVRELAGVPDIGDLVLRDAVTIEELIKLRETRDAVAFREWFHANCDREPLGLAKAYAEMVERVKIQLSWPARIIRFVIGQVVPVGAGLAIGDPLTGAAAGVAATALNEWLCKNIIRGNSPKFFIDDLRQLEAPATRS